VCVTKAKLAIVTQLFNISSIGKKIMTIRLNLLLTTICALMYVHVILNLIQITIKL
jgi:hypothetical protein